ncbi:MAG: hypothetical protein HKN21_08240 [Candidatus Eisenbacteria bacterium]|uniref:Uncharacterized protein n=1 Tax=Eiseniibacteriota bacterium TaxID=2212470 RepID=A0A7Y2EB68_UNCEI|nr:hypothetical protein [Candidatus Eisenbacteria bacterium]
MFPNLAFNLQAAQVLELWIGAFLTLMIFSFLYKDNPFYKFAEHLFVGVSAAYWMVQAFWSTLIPNLFGKLYPPMVEPFLPEIAGNEADFFKLIPLVFGIFLLMRLVPPWAVVARLAMGLVIGFAAGTNLTRYLQSDFISQIDHTLLPLIAFDDAGFSLRETIKNLMVVSGVVAGLIYFFFSAEHKGLFGKASRYGIWVLMVSFGAAFGYTVMARISLLTGRMNFLGDWLTHMFSGNLPT